MSVYQARSNTGEWLDVETDSPRVAGLLVAGHEDSYILVRRDTAAQGKWYYHVIEGELVEISRAEFLEAVMV